LSEAEQNILSYLEEDAECFEAWFQLARVHAARDRLEQARDALVHALENGFTDIESMDGDAKLKAVYESLSVT
jgi:hypothetical protein